MTQDEKWNMKWQEVMDYTREYQRNPSRHRIEEHLMLNFVKYNRKLLKAGKLKEDRIAPFSQLLALSEEYKRQNQYK